MKYIFPLNYKYSNKLFGIIEYRTLLPLSIYGAIIIFILSILNLDFFVSFAIFTIMFLPLLLIMSVDVLGEPFIPFLVSIIQFKKNSKIYLYNYTK